MLWFLHLFRPMGLDLMIILTIESHQVGVLVSITRVYDSCIVPLCKHLQFRSTSGVSAQWIPYYTHYQKLFIKCLFN